MTALLLQVVGALALAIGFGMLTVWLGVVVGGALILLAGVILELEARDGIRQSDPSE